MCVSCNWILYGIQALIEWVFLMYCKRLNRWILIDCASCLICAFGLFLKRAPHFECFPPFLLLYFSLFHTHTHATPSLCVLFCLCVSLSLCLCLFFSLSIYLIVHSMGNLCASFSQYIHNHVFIQRFNNWSEFRSGFSIIFKWFIFSVRYFICYIYSY